METFQLKHFLDAFPEVCTTKFHRIYDFSRIERDFQHLAQGERPLVARDVIKLFDDKSTPFGRYWPNPNESELDQVLKRNRILLGPVPERPGELVRRLIEVFRSTGVVSIILRFTHPNRFGIISPPVLSLLQVYRANTADLYLAYCDELAEWRNHFAMPTVASTEMALWSFYQLTEGGAKAGGSEKALREFEADVWIQRRRLAHVLRPFLKRYGPLELARLLCDEDPNLAGKIAAEEYERLLRCAARRYYPKMPLNRDWARALIERLATDQIIELQHKTTLQRVWEIRNNAVHATAKPAYEEVELMLDCIYSICSSWCAET